MTSGEEESVAMMRMDSVSANILDSENPSKPGKWKIERKERNRLWVSLFATDDTTAHSSLLLLYLPFLSLQITVLF